MRRALFALPLLLCAHTALAQQAPSFDGVAARVKPGAQVDITLAGGQRLEGAVVEVSSLKLTVNVAGVKRVLDPAGVEKIVHRDSRLNGMLIGLGSGLVAGGLMGALMNTTCSNEGHDGCRAAAVGWIAFGAGAGAFIGAGLDGSRHRTIYDASRPAKTVAVSLLIGAREQGLALTIRF